MYLVRYTLFTVCLKFVFFSKTRYSFSWWCIECSANSCYVWQHFSYKPSVSQSTRLVLEICTQHIFGATNIILVQTSVNTASDSVRTMMINQSWIWKIPCSLLWEKVIWNSLLKTYQRRRDNWLRKTRRFLLQNMKNSHIQWSPRRLFALLTKQITIPADSVPTLSSW